MKWLWWTIGIAIGVLLLAYVGISWYFSEIIINRGVHLFPKLTEVFVDTTKQFVVLKERHILVPAMPKCRRWPHYQEGARIGRTRQ